MGGGGPFLELGRKATSPSPSDTLPSPLPLSSSPASLPTTHPLRPSPHHHHPLTSPSGTSGSFNGPCSGSTREVGDADLRSCSASCTAGGGEGRHARGGGWKQTGTGGEWDTQEVAHSCTGKAAQGRCGLTHPRAQCTLHHRTDARVPPARPPSPIHIPCYTLSENVISPDSAVGGSASWGAGAGSLQPLSHHTPTLFNFTPCPRT